MQIYFPSEGVGRDKSPKTLGGLEMLPSQVTTCLKERSSLGAEGADMLFQPQKDLIKFNGDHCWLTGETVLADFRG